MLMIWPDLAAIIIGAKRSDHQVGRAQVGVHHLVPLLHRQIDEWLAQDTDAGIVDQDVAAAVFLRRPAPPSAATAFSSVKSQGSTIAFPPCCSMPLLPASSRAWSRAVSTTAAPMRARRDGNGLADAARRARDHRYLVA